MIPVIALVGRPNVGKSTLFNRLTRTREAIVADFSGLTRDRHYGTAKLGKRQFIVVDTGGLEDSAEGAIFEKMASQTLQAIAEADLVLFMVDARAGLSAQDQEIGRYLRKIGKRTLIIANKAEGMKDSLHLAEFYELGLGEVYAVSAAHGQGVRELLELAAAELPAVPEPDADAEEDEDQPIRIAVAGRPNAGKSTLINAWLGEERLVTFDMPGTTRDAIRVPFEKNGRRYELIDTAGLRRKGKVFESIEKFSVVKTLQAIEGAHVVVLVLDGTQGVTDQDAHIAGYALESGRAVVVAINKWDALDRYQREQLARSLELRLAFMRFAPVKHISALRRQGLEPLWKAMGAAYDAATRKMPTAKLTRLLQEAVQYQAPRKSGMFRPKPRYAHQGGMNPPVIVIHGNSLDHVGHAYQRFLEGWFRKAFKLDGTPLRIEFRTSDNPYSHKD
ncbi:ribosome biogenesis GTPase Der [Corticibacter populi]|uniref:GTPase Der n=1 Tax=Corticibacter populi TaxID=1550736 RepID=A0A3M6QXS6_9BURK|nr:ribosome biogenesis GTPase Der [Corticibacter populi]RMX07818.1 ribosome biogenesis GTPase Der [Corticibacter populi]RZS35051.1 GTP-binding protein [Corticibacter populi]